MEEDILQGGSACCRDVSPVSLIQITIVFAFKGFKYSIIFKILQVSFVP